MGVVSYTFSKCSPERGEGKVYLSDRVARVDQLVVMVVNKGLTFSVQFAYLCGESGCQEPSLASAKCRPFQTHRSRVRSRGARGRAKTRSKRAS